MAKVLVKQDSKPRRENATCSTTSPLRVMFLSKSNIDKKKSYTMLIDERQGRPHSDDVRSLVRTLSKAQTHLGQGEPFNNLKQKQLQDALNL